MTAPPDLLDDLMVSTANLRRMSHVLGAQSQQVPEHVMGSADLAADLRSLLHECGDWMTSMAMRVEDFARTAEQHRITDEEPPHEWPGPTDLAP